jgi:hypothetical protein
MSVSIRVSVAGDALVAERDGLPIASIGLTSGSIVAGPVPSRGEVARQLRQRRYGLLRQGGQVTPARSLLRRLATQATG